MIRVAYSSAASAHAKWPASTMSDLLWGSRSCRYSPFTGSTPGSWSPVMICTGVSIEGSSLPSTGSSAGYERTKRSDSTKRSPSYELKKSSHVVGKLVTLDERKDRLDTLARVDVAEGLETRRCDDVFQHRGDLNGHSGRAVADDDAPQKARMLRGGEQQRRRPDVGADCVRAPESELFDDVSDELAHCRRREQVVPPLRVPEPWQVDRHEVCVLGESGHICSNVKRLSGHGLRRIADTSRASLSAYRIDKPSIFRTCVFMSEWVEMVIMGSLTRDRCFDLRLECGCVSPTFPTFVFVTITFFLRLTSFRVLRNLDG